MSINKHLRFIYMNTWINQYNLNQKLHCLALPYHYTQLKTGVLVVIWYHLYHNIIRRCADKGHSISLAFRGWGYFGEILVNTLHWLELSNIITELPHKPGVASISPVVPTKLLRAACLLVILGVMVTYHWVHTWFSHNMGQPKIISLD